MMISDVKGAALETAMGLGSVKATFHPTPYTANVWQGADGINRWEVSADIVGGTLDTSTQAGAFAYDVPYDTSRLGVSISNAPGTVTLNLSEVNIFDNEAGMLLENPQTDLSIVDSVVADNLSAGLESVNRATSVTSANVFWNSWTGPNPPGSGETLVGPLVFDQAYWGGFVRQPVSFGGGDFILPVFLNNDRYPLNRLTVGQLNQDSLVTFFPPRDRHGCNNAIETALSAGTTIIGTVTLTIQYDEVRDVPPGGNEKYMNLHKWNGSSWDFVPGATRDEANNTLTRDLGVLGMGIYGVIHDDSIIPTEVDEWVVHE
jgi:hypothetical protein